MIWYSLFPVGQIVGVESNHTSDVLALLSKEPLHTTGAISPWSLYRVKYSSHPNLTNDVLSPHLACYIPMLPCDGTTSILASDEPTEDELGYPLGMWCCVMDIHVALIYIYM